MVRESTPRETFEFDDLKYLKNIRKISEECRNRGFHRVQKEPSLYGQTVCYDCSAPVWHQDKNINNIDYRVEPL